MNAASWLLCAVLVDPTGGASLGNVTTWEDVLPDWREALTGGEIRLRNRLRYEGIDRDDFGRDANALTLRSALGYRTQTFHDWTGFVEFEDVTALGSKDYDSTLNGEDDRPVVPDPEATELNQLYVDYSGLPDANLRVGRQVVSYGNERFIARRGWRQNEQTFDALSVDYRATDDLQLHYAFLHHLNDPLSDDSPIGSVEMASHLLHVDATLSEWGTLAGYAYWLDFRDDAGLDPLSTVTTGARLETEHAVGEGVALDFDIELAFQRDVGDNPNNVEQPYIASELEIHVDRASLAIGVDVQGGSGDPGESFRAVLGARHPFNGLADRFVVTPDDGLEDFYLRAGTRFGSTSLSVEWHEYEAQEGSAEFGSEFDLTVTVPLLESLTLVGTYALVDGRSFVDDSQTVLVWLDFRP